VFLLSNTTVWWIDVAIYYLLHREQLYVSALGNGDLQVENETHGKQLHKTYIWATYWGCEGVKWSRDLVSVLKFGWCGLHGGSMLLPNYV